MATLAELREKVRTQVDVTGLELPDATIDWYLQQAFDRTTAAENTWPYYQTHWDLTLQPGETTMPLPSDCNPVSIVSLTSDENYNRPLHMINQETAEDVYFLVPGTISPWVTEFSVWGGDIYLWPPTDYPEAQGYTLRGYRLPESMTTTAGQIDADRRLHLPLVNYACALAYAQQEDTTLEATYMERWQRDVEMARQAIMEPQRNRPVYMGGGLRRGWRF